MIVGTAGHIDHGKTALVKALTGIDADRLAEEKARGITIDLGFAYWPAAPDRITGFVDVPGHERFVHTMLAGASGIDFALLVVAADDGPMPQTREHLAILDLLGIRRGMVALTKADLADAARRNDVISDIRSMLDGTSLGGAAILPVSTVTGEGIGALKAVLAEAERATPDRGAGGRFRLAVDRSFTLTGVGTIVTGTVLSGRVQVGDRVLLSPSGLAARVRSIHAQNRPAAVGEAGQRCALNIAGESIGRDAARRGEMVLDPLLHAPTDRIDVEIRLLDGETRIGAQGFSARLHHAGAEAGVRIVPLADHILPGAVGKAQLVLDRSIPAAVQDRFVLRDVSARRTIGGGRFLDLRPPARKRRSPARLAELDALADPDPARALARRLAGAPFVVDLSVFARDHALTEAEAAAAVVTAGATTIAAGPSLLAMAPDQRLRLSGNLAIGVARFHADNPDQQGIGRERLRLATEPRLPPAAFAAVLEDEVRADALVLDGAFVRLPGHKVQLTGADEALWHDIAPMLDGAARFRPPRVRDVARDLGVGEGEVRRVLKLCARLGRADQIAHDHFFLRATTAEMVGLARAVAEKAAGGEFSAAVFRDTMDNGRKVAIQILDFFDRHGITLRRGDLRRINRHRLDLFGAPRFEADEGRETSPVGRPDFKSGWGSGPVPGGFDSRSLPPST